MKLKLNMLLMVFAILACSLPAPLEGKSPVVDLLDKEVGHEPKDSELDTLVALSQDAQDPLDRIEQLEKQLQKEQNQNLARDEKVQQLEQQLKDIMGKSNGEDISDILSNDTFSNLGATFRRHDEQEQIAFSVALSHDFGLVSHPINIPFDIVYLNIGDGWEPSIKAFRVPISGVYLFSVYIVNKKATHVRAHIVHDGTTKSSLFADSSGFQTGANQLILQVEAGEYVVVEIEEGSLRGDTNNYVRLYNTFSGFLLYASSPTP